MTKTYLLAAALAFAFGGGAMAQQVPIINGDLTCSQWVADHSAPNRNEVIAALQNGYVLGFTDAMSSAQGRASLEPTKFNWFLTSITRYCQQNPTDLVMTAAGTVAADFDQTYRNQR